MPAVMPSKRPRSPKGRTREAAVQLAGAYPEAICELDHTNPFELLAATILSAQCTDARVNMVTPALFARYPTPDALAVADPGELEEIVRSTGFYASKAKNLVGMATALRDRFAGEVPTALDDLVALPGVVVDTHVIRLSNRLGITDETDPVKIEHAIAGFLPAGDRGAFSLRLILHGRRVCDARRPACDACAVESFCPSSCLSSSLR